jgi:hypothetical protein
MDPAAYDFLEYLRETTDNEYGDFKRRTDLHLRRLLEAYPNMTPEDFAEAKRLRFELLWSHEEDPPLEKVKQDFMRWALALH